MDFLKWHYTTAYKKIIILGKNLLLFPIYFLSVKTHLSTFFNPWKRQRLKMKPGFHIADFLAVVSFNAIAICIGIMLRTTLLFYAVILSLVSAIAAFFLVISWLFLPLISIFYYRSEISKKEVDAASLIEKTGNNWQDFPLILFKHRQARFILQHLGLDVDQLSAGFEKEKNLLDSASLINFISKKGRDIRIADLIFAMAMSYPATKKFFESEHIKEEDLYQIERWYLMREIKFDKPLFIDIERIKKMPGIGYDWAYGYTVELDKYSTNILGTEMVYPKLIGRENELKELERILLKTQNNNALLVGEPGVGRHAIVETLAHRAATGYTNQVLSHKRIVLLNMQALVSAKPSILEAKGLASEILAEAEDAGNIIIVIDDFDKFVSTGEGRIELSDIFTKYAQSPIGVIGLTTPAAYHKYVKVNSSLTPLFEKVDVAEPDLDTVVKELELSIVPVLEKKYNITITYLAVKKVIADCERFISTSPYPAKAIDLLDQSAVLMITRKKGIILKPIDIENFLLEKYHFSEGELQKKEKERLLILEDLLHKRVVNQNEAIKAISSALRRSRLEVSSNKRPMGSFLFLGPTGVGKTETAKALAEIYFGSEDNMLRFDMSEYQKEEGIERLIGSIKLGTPGELTSQLTDHPFSLVLLDEFEKSEKTIYNLFLTLTDEGYIADAAGKRISARNTIVIATSNAGAEYVRESIKKGLSQTDLTKSVIEFVQREHIFSPELLNRFDALVVFSPLSEENLKEVARLMLVDLNKRLAKKEIQIEITPQLIDKLITYGFDPELGCRLMRRVIAERVEDVVAKKLLSGEVKKGEKIKIEI